MTLVTDSWQAFQTLCDGVTDFSSSARGTSDQIASSLRIDPDPRSLPLPKDQKLQSSSTVPYLQLAASPNSLVRPSSQTTSRHTLTLVIKESTNSIKVRLPLNQPHTYVEPLHVPRAHQSSKPAAKRLHTSTPTMASDKPQTAEKPEQAQTAQKSSATLEEDDEFEDFPVEGM